MKRKGTLGLAVMTMAALFCFLAPTSQAATVNGYMEFNGALELWIWTTTGKTAIGTPVTGTTVPAQMADPAKVQVYDASGTLVNEFRNYRPDPDGYGAMSNWKLGLTTTDGLVAWSLAFSPQPILTNWGQIAIATDVIEPTDAPDYDNVGDSKPWFAQNAGGQPTWWCESQSDALGYDMFDPGRFVDYVALTFDNSALRPDGTLALWIGGFVTEDLAQLEVGNAPYAVLEGSMKSLVKYDDDGDGYFSDTDCDDDPAQDPALCSVCVCELDPICAGCARCIHAGATEVTGDAYDTNCNGQLDCFIATASFGTEMEGKVSALRDFRDSHLLNHHWGRVLVDLYYTYSPPMASYIDNHAGLKTAVRTALLPVVGAAWLVNSSKGAVAGLALGMVALGLVLRRKEKLGGMLVLLLAVGFLAVPMAADADMQSDMDDVIQKSSNCIGAVESLLAAGYPEADVIPAVLAGCEDGVADVIASAIRAGADPFTVAYAAKGAGVDLGEVVTALEDVSGNAAEDTAGFAPPAPPISISSAPVVVISGTGSSWGQSHYVASPSL